MDYEESKRLGIEVSNEITSCIGAIRNRYFDSDDFESNTAMTFGIVSATIQELLDMSPDYPDPEQRKDWVKQLLCMAIDTAQVMTTVTLEN